jgi:predicted KAP-like P-loop ATPase
MREWFKRITGKQEKSKPDAMPTAAGAPAGAAATPTQPSAEHFVSDEPITGAAEDRFNRAPFAIRIADTIARRPDIASLVVGVFGPWGDGKTSVLKLMEEELKRHDNVVVLRFNPWHFQSEEQLIRGFFATLAEGLDQELNTAQEKIGKILKDYGSLLSLGSFAMAGGAIQLRPGDAAKGLGEALSNVGLDKLRLRIDSILAASGKRVVVLVDDIDRLDRAETHSMFKLVKLSAGFNHTAYVLAFDDEVVAAALGERYGAGGQQAGRAFLEKIIQVPLHLPPVDEVALRQVAFEGVQAAVDMAGIQVTQPDADAFMRHFVDGLERKLTTPRVAKLYTNALMFALPLLKGEVNTMNLMLIEGIRVLYPALYAAIRDNPSLFLAGQERALHGMELAPNRLDEVVDAALPGCTPGDREAIRTRLLKPLFPRTGNAIYGHEWDAEWARAQKICSEAYFKRYFTYCVPDGDIADASIAELLDRLPTDDDTVKRERLAQFERRRSMPRLISTLRQRINGTDADRAAALARAIALSGDLMVRERGQIMVTPD